MKKKLIIIVSFVALIATISFKHQQPTFKIRGTITGLTNGEVYLTHTGNNGTVTDSTSVKNGAFFFKGSTPEPLDYTIKLSGSKQQLMFFVENTDITIVANKDSLYKANIKGSATQDMWNEYLKEWSVVTKYAGKYYHMADSINKVYNQKPDSAAKAMLKAEYKKLGDFDLAFHTRFVQTHPGSIICAYAINTHFIPYFQYNEARTLFGYLTDGVKKSYYGKQIVESLVIEKRSGIGAHPSFVMNDVNGKPVSLASFKGKYVLVDFWASWCAPCRRENPNVLANYKKYHADGFEVLGVSLDSKREPWIKAIEADGLIWTHVSDLKGWDNTAAKEFGVKVVPTNFLLDRDGKVIAKNVREEELEKELKSIFNK